MRLAALIGLGILEELTFAALLRLGDLKTELVPFLFLVLAAGTFYLIAVALVLRPVVAKASRAELRWILLAALAFRITLLPLAPTLTVNLTGNLQRANWDGKIQHSGFNPYRFAPNYPLFDPIRTRQDAQVADPSVGSVAPPLAELIDRWNYGINYALAGVGLRRLKILYTFFDLLIVLLLLAMLRERGLPAGRVLIYAWAPLTTIEIAGNGHGEAVAIFFALLALYWASKHGRAAGATMGAAVTSGVYSLALLPTVWADLERPARRRFALWGTTVAVLVSAPYLFAYKQFMFKSVGANLRAHSALWIHNNDSLFHLLTRAFGDGATGLTLAKATALAVLASSIALTLARKMDPPRAALAILSTGLLVAPNVFPWYVLWLMPWLVFYPEAPWLFFSLAVFWGYQGVVAQSVTGGGIYDWRITLMEYAPLYSLLLWRGIRGTWRGSGRHA